MESISEDGLHQNKKERGSFATFSLLKPIYKDSKMALLTQESRKISPKSTISNDYKYIGGLRKKYVEKLRRRFWAKVDRRGPKECWPWIGAQQPRGYGNIGIVRNGKRESIGAHCISFELNTGPIGDGQIVAHLCDNPNCVNPRHLLSATTAFNALDCITKGRWVKSVQPAWAQEEG